MEKIIYVGNVNVINSINQDDYADRESYLSDLMLELPTKILDQINYEIQKIENNIKT